MNTRKVGEMMMDKLILIVDDARFARNLTKRALASGGYTNIIEAATAAEAIVAFTDNKPDLTLLDITLPDISDLTLLKRMMQEDPDARIVMASAIGQDLIIADALSAGAVDFITKPFDEEDFLSIVKNVLEN